MGSLSCSQKKIPPTVNFLMSVKISTTSYPIRLKTIFNIIMTSTATSYKRFPLLSFEAVFRFYACYMSGSARLHQLTLSQITSYDAACYTILSILT